MSTIHQTFSSESYLGVRPNPVLTGFSQTSSFNFFTGADPTQYVLFEFPLRELTPS